MLLHGLQVGAAVSFTSGLRRCCSGTARSSSVPAAALHAGLRGSVSSGGAHLPLPPPGSGNPLHLLPGGLRHPSLHEPGHLRLSG